MSTETFELGNTAYESYTHVMLYSMLISHESCPTLNDQPNSDYVMYTLSLNPLVKSVVLMFYPLSLSHNISLVIDIQ